MNTKEEKEKMFYWRHTLCMEQPHFVFFPFVLPSEWKIFPETK